jgi:oligoribonuclease NrnB/cAMP/cGMP phosphodiesterase (DHH superfamily)
MKKTLVLHHSADLDGILSGVIANYYLQHTKSPDDKIIIHGADYGDNLDKQYDGYSLSEFDDIYVIDFSDDWLFTSEHANKIIWIDHHINEIEKNYNVAKYVIDGVAACRLTQQFFCNLNHAFLQLHNYQERQVNEPLFVALIGEYDIWDESSIYARPLNFGITNTSFENIDLVYRETRSELAHVKNQVFYSEKLAFYIEIGKGVIDFIQKTSPILGGGVPINIFGHQGVSFNTHIRSSLIHRQKPNEEFTMVWNYTGKDKIKLSFYAEGDKPECLKFAQFFGGGGHRRACGCQVDIHTLSLILKNHYANVKQ